MRISEGLLALRIPPAQCDTRAQSIASMRAVGDRRKAAVHTAVRSRGRQGSESVHVLRPAFDRAPPLPPGFASPPSSAWHRHASLGAANIDIANAVTGLLGAASIRRSQAQGVWPDGGRWRLNRNCAAMGMRLFATLRWQRRCPPRMAGERARTQTVRGAVCAWRAPGAMPQACTDSLPRRPWLCTAV